MKRLPIFALILSAPLLSGCAIFGIAAVGGVAAETATSDGNPEASNGIVARQWQAACAEIGGSVDPKTGDCNGDLFGYFLGDDKPAPAEPQPVGYQPPAAQPQAAEPQPVPSQPQSIQLEPVPSQPVESQ